MRDQYVGDISDLVKFALLRSLASSDRTLGVSWYYVDAHDGGPDGRHVEWQSEEAWRILDPVVADALSRLPARSVDALQLLDIFPNRTVFFADPVPTAAYRKHWATEQVRALRGLDLVFVDPDNGLGRSSRKHADVEEIVELAANGSSVVFISFPGRRPHVELVQNIHQSLLKASAASKVATLRTSISLRSEGAKSFTPRQRWFTIIEPDDVLLDRLNTFSRLLATMPRTRAAVDLTARR